MAVAPPEIEIETIGRHVSECPGGNVEYMLRLLFDFWAGEKRSNIESTIREAHLTPKMAEKLRTATQKHIAGFRTSTLDVIAQIGGTSGGTMDGTGSSSGR